MADETDIVPHAPDEAPAVAGKRGPSGWRRFQRWVVGLVLAALVVVGGTLVWLDTQWGHRFIVARIVALAPKSGLRISVGKIEGSIYSKAVLRDLVLSDPKGRFLTIPAAALDWWPFAWATNRLDIDRLIIPDATLHRLPVLRPTRVQGPILPDFDIRIMEMRVGRLRVEKAVGGKTQVATLSGRADIRSGRAVIDLAGRTLDGADQLVVGIDSRPDEDRFNINANVIAPRGGVLAAFAGLKQDGRLTVSGRGSWRQWKGRALASLDNKPLADIGLLARSGQYTLSGTIEGANIAGNGIVARMAAPRLQLNAQGTFQNRVLAGTLNLASAALALEAKGGLDLGHSVFDNLDATLRLTRPGALLKGLSGQDVQGRLRIDGPFREAGFEYLLTARRIASGKTVVNGFRARGAGRLGGDNPTLIPVKAQAATVIGQGQVIDGLLRNISLDGVLQLHQGVLTSNKMRLRSDRLDGGILLVADLPKGTWNAGFIGAINGLSIPGFGIVDVRSDVKLVSGKGGGFGLTGKADAAMRRLDNAFLRGLAGGLPRVSTGLSLGPDGQVRFNGLRLSAPAISLAANGYRRRDGTFHFEGSGKHASYGPLRLTLDGRIDRPLVDVTLDRPFNGAGGLKDVHARLVPDAAGYQLSASGQTILGPFQGDGAILLPPGAQAVIDVRRLDVGGAIASGRLLPVTGGLQGRLDVTGNGVTGALDLSVVDMVQQVAANFDIRRARFAGPPPIVIAGGKISALVRLDPAGTSVEANVQLRGMRRGGLRVGRFVAAAKLVDGAGQVTASLTGQRGRLFDIQAKADIAPGRIQVTAGGTLDRRPIRIVNGGLLTDTGNGWRLSPTTISYAGGQTQLSGLLGGDATEVQARLNRMPLTVLDIFNSNLGLAGIATGTVSVVQPRGGVPTGKAELRIRGLSRSGLTLSSTPVDVGVNALLDANRMAARAVIVDKGQTIGRAQMMLTPLGEGTLADRLTNAPLFAQLRYNGRADTLWRLTGVEIIDLTGPVAIGADIRGTLVDPRISGSLAAQNAGLQSAVTGMQLSGVSARGRFNGSQLAISNFSGTAKGGGSVSGSGRFTFSSRGVGIDLNMQAQNATLIERDDIGATVTGPIAITSDGDGGVISGKVDLIRSSFRLGRAAAVARIPQLRVVEVNRNGDEIEDERPPSPWRLDLQANARNRMMVSGLGLESEWRGDLSIRGTVTDPAISGRVDLVRGNYEFAGRRFDLREGRIDFDGSVPANPRLDIEAQAQVSDLNATIKVTGTGNKPEIDFTSIPALPEDELLSRLLFGTSITNLSAPEAVQLAAAVASLQGTGGGLDPINAVRKATGLDRLRILPADATTGQGTSIAAGKYITRRTYVELITDGQGYSATRVEFQITRWLSLLSSVSTIGRQSVNVRVSKDY